MTEPCFQGGYTEPRLLYKVITRKGDVRLVDVNYEHSDDWEYFATIDPVEWLEKFLSSDVIEAVKMIDDLNGL